MRILADSQIGNAVSITATNVKSFAGTDKLQNYHLVDKTEINTGITQIIIDYGASPPPISSMALYFGAPDKVPAGKVSPITFIRLVSSVISPDTCETK